MRFRLSRLGVTMGDPMAGTLGFALPLTPACDSG